MIILGKRYTFSQLELSRLKAKHFKVHFITYAEKDPKEVIKNIQKIIHEKQIKIIVLNTKVSVPDELVQFLTNLQFSSNVKFLGIEKFLEEYLQKCFIPDSKRDLHYLDSIKAFSPFQYAQKRMVDIIGAIILLILSFPLMILAFFKIKAQSPGKAIFKQKRVGKNNKEFTCLKFRSMHLDAEKNGVQFAKQNDPRIFPFGEVMRKTRIDELPQLFNVLKGDMHIIGPRPERLFWIKQFELHIPYYNERHLIRPGITGHAQVMYPYGENQEDAKQKLMYDLYYIKYWNLWLETKIVFKTILVILNKKGQ